MSALFRGPVWPILATRSSASRSTRRKSLGLREGHVPIYEPGLSELVLANQAAGRLSFTTSLKEAGRGAQAIFIAVGTPSLAEVGSADMHFVHDAARAIGEIIEGFTVVVVKSTVPIGAGDEVERIIAKHAPQGSFAVVSNPEFLREGAAIEDFKRARSSGHRHRGRPRARGDGRDLSAHRTQRGADRLYVASQLGDDQIRRQRVPGDESDFHQRNR